MGKLVFDIETIGEDFNALDETTRSVLTRWIKREAHNEDEYEASLEDVKNGLGFSPLTGQIVAIGVYDVQKNIGGVYYQSPDAPREDFEEDGIRYRAMSEHDMLAKFWQLALQYQEFISFNGRGFDVPFLMTRSAIHGIRPSKNLMANRYLSLQPKNSVHIDLLDQFTFYGTVRRRGNLHLYCRAFGIKSPKAEGVNGDDVGMLFGEGRYLKIAKYNAGDLLATKSLFEYWQEYLQ